jgi:fimbrial chaperone protein
MLRIAVLALLAMAPALDAMAGAFGVSPIRLELDPGSRSGLVTVSNDDERKLYFQLKLFEWTQTPTGEDKLAESDALIFFPQILSVDPKERRIVRVGVKAPPAGPERAFRLFIEEMPDPNEAAAGGAQIAVRLRFGVPIFVSSGKGDPQPEIASVTATKGAIQVAVRNPGARQVRLEELVARAGDRVVGKVAGWYVFPGATRAFTIPVAPADCPLGKAIEIDARGDGKEARKSFEPPRELCAP